MHSIEELDYMKGNKITVKPASDPAPGTKIEAEGDLITVGDITFYEPNLKGFIEENTSAVYYKVDESGNIIDSALPEEKPITEYLQSKDRIIEKEDNSKYEFFNYKNTELKSIWANVKIDNNGVITYWVWIPRYAYKIDENNIYIKYIDINDNIAGTNDKATDEGYIVHTAFVENSKKGIWVTKYEMEQVVDNNMGDFPYYTPEMTGFDPNTTWIEVYKDDGTFEEVQLSTIKNLPEFVKKNRWFDYENQIWANIKIKVGDAETWWVWIPRYAYKIFGNSTSVIFLDTDNIPLSGDDLPDDYIVHPAFNNSQKGIWVSKYEVEQKLIETGTTNNVNIPDMTGFDPNTTWIEIYKDDGTFEEVKLSTVTNIEQFARDNRWYDYSNKIWANIKTKVGDAEAWWVWIPKYAYSILGNETSIIFLNENGTTRDGSELPADYIPHPGFEGRAGIWASKYEISKKEN